MATAMGRLCVGRCSVLLPPFVALCYTGRMTSTEHTMNRHNLYCPETGREVAGPVVFLDAYLGWVREISLEQGQYATEVISL